MGYVPDIIIQELRSGSHQRAIFFRMDSDPPLRLWLGINDIPQQIPTIDVEEETYIGRGLLHDVPELEVLLNGAADRVNFTLSGIDPDTSALADTEIPPIRGAKVHVGITTLDERYQPMSDIIPMMVGRASFVTEQVEPVKGYETQQITMGLSVGFGPTTRSRRSQALWSHAQHIAIHPTDDFCKNTSRYARGSEAVWPRW